MSKVKETLRMNADELKDHLKYVIDNNQFLQVRGILPIATCVEGHAGLGKTSVVMQLAQELGLQCVKRNLAEVEEAADLLGFPLRQFKLCRKVEEKEECIWVDDHAVHEYTKNGFNFTGIKRTTYCPPEWIADKEEGGILILDDFNRADPRIIQGAMEIINRQEYTSWKLPRNWHVVMTQNPDDGNYMVNSQDVAHKTRYSTLTMKWDVECWARRAEKDGIDGRGINFMLKHPDIIKDDSLKNGINPRTLSNFFNSIASIKDFEKDLPKIQQMGESSVGVEVSSLFTTFINNRLDKLLSPNDILTKDWKYVKGELTDIIGIGTNYRPDIASIITTRIINYSLHYSEKNSIDQKIITRITEIINTPDLIAMDLKYIIIRELLNRSNKFKRIMLDQGVAKMSIK